MNAFTDEQKVVIYRVKSKIVLHFQEFKLKPWYNSNLPWDKVYLSGGAIASLFQNEKPKDWDLYFEDDFTQSIFHNYLTSASVKEYIEDVNEKYQEYVGVDGKMITSNSITMKGGDSFIICMNGKPKDVKQKFDYVHCTPHYDIMDMKLYISSKQYQAIENKKLIVNNQNSITTYRKNKFIERGYTE